METIMTIILILAVLSVIAAWYNTRIILKELKLIKKHLNISDDKKQPFISNDLDNE